MKPAELDLSMARRALDGVVVVDELDDDAIAERYARVVWNVVTEPGDGVAGMLVDALGAAPALAVVAGGSAVAPVEGMSAREFAEGRKRWTPRLRSVEVDDALALARARGVRLVFPEDPEWPQQVDDLGPHAPLVLWVRGTTSALASLTPSVAVVGARAATSYGEHVAAELAAESAGSGIPVVSGAAYGIDAAAHRAALAVGGTTVALLAGGADRPYPAGNGRLIDRIAETGAVVSEVPCGGAPTKWRFLQRNRVIAALADATVVVEAGWRSGSLNTASHARALGRPTGAVPGPVTSAASAGCHRMLREFDARCITSADDVRELIGLDSATGARRSGPGAGGARTDDASRVIDALSARVWRATEDVARRSGMTPQQVEALLGIMLLEERIEHGERGWRLRFATS
ncbi:DNA-processing protein DprA [Microbacterium immunditiarum]|uniref:DNA processing protein n=1 Tax=Microbacterium immunditiarum TaxID=337480 RepID=A0A7Y9GP74_9MICO|nr:DNA-processing protein DprA [Microbacterium immunditiarum]NYE20149.1 DNA processing protein [Microbacterium immunditiarum]